MNCLIPFYRIFRGSQINDAVFTAVQAGMVPFRRLNGRGKQPLKQSRRNPGLVEGNPCGAAGAVPVAVPGTVQDAAETASIGLTLVCTRDLEVGLGLIVALVAVQGVAVFVTGKVKYNVL